MIRLGPIWKLYILHATTLLTLVVVTGFVLQGQLKYRLKLQVEDELFTLARVLARSLPDSEEPDVIRSWCREAGKITQLRITVMKTSGQVIGDSEDKLVSEDSHLDRPEVAGALADGIAAAVRYSNTSGTEMLYAAYLVEEKQVILRLAMPMTMVKTIENEVMIFFVFAVYLTPFIAVGISFLFARYLGAQNDSSRRRPRATDCRSKEKTCRP